MAVSAYSQGDDGGVGQVPGGIDNDVEFFRSHRACRNIAQALSLVGVGDGADQPASYVVLCLVLGEAG